jgi:hypothetical protein
MEFPVVADATNAKSPIGYSPINNTPFKSAIKVQMNGV